MYNHSRSKKSDFCLSTKNSRSFDINSSSDIPSKRNFYGVELFLLSGSFWRASTIFILVSHETFSSKKDKAHRSGEMYQKRAFNLCTVAFEIKLSIVSHSLSLLKNCISLFGAEIAKGGVKHALI